MNLEPSESAAVSELLERARTGNPDAVNTLIERTVQRLRHLARQMLNSSPALRRWTGSDDLLQNALIRLMRARGARHPPATPEPPLVGSAAIAEPEVSQPVEPAAVVPATPTVTRSVEQDVAAAPEARPQLPRADDEGVVAVVGEEFQVGARAIDRPVLGRAGALGAGLVAGDQVFAELANGNFFQGQVKAFGAEDVTLRVERGEVTLEFAALVRLGSVTSEDYSELMRSTPGLVRLTNDNQLMGSIVRGADGQVALQVESNRIIIPTGEIDEVGDAVPGGVRVGGAADDEWIEQLIENRLEKKRVEAQRSGAGQGGSR